MDAKLKDLVTFRCKPQDRAELKRVSASLALTESDVARAAFRAGIKVVGNVGIWPTKPEPHPD